MIEALSGVAAVLLWIPFSFLGYANQLIDVVFNKQPDIFQEPGIVYSVKQAESLGFNPQTLYLEMLEELNPQYLRLIAYWDRIEKKRGEYDFSELDFQMQEAEKRNKKVTLILGYKVPRWPECHFPEWYFELSEEEKTKAIFALIRTVVTRYKDSPAIEYWQLENEVFYSFGLCPKIPVSVFEKELKLLKSLDDHPVVVTASGELDTWLRAFWYGDKVGLSVYRRFFVSTPLVKTGLDFPLPPLFYKTKAWPFKIFFKKDIMITELQLEPWLDEAINVVPIEKQFKELSFERFQSYIQYAKRTRISRVYLWGVEWWYWLSRNGHPEFLNYVQETVFTN